MKTIKYDMIMASQMVMKYIVLEVISGVLYNKIFYQTWEAVEPKTPLIFLIENGDVYDEDD